MTTEHPDTVPTDPGRPVAHGPGASARQAERWQERRSRAALTRLLEPGDGIGAAAVEAWGAVRALQLLTGTETPTAQERQELTLVAEGRGHRVGTSTWTEARKRWDTRVADLAPDRDLAVMDRLGGGLLIPSDEQWPKALDDLGPQAPVALWYRGTGPLPPPERTLAVVGSREATSYGQAVTRQLAGGASHRGVSVLSGGAYGIDAAAHRAALEVAGGDPPTMAVMAGGLDRYYPAGNETLLRQVADHGLLLSETAPGASPTRYRFLTRNRLIAALSGAVLVVEARWRSGAQNTAGHALTLGREVGVVPGPITSAASAGCHRLLRETPAWVVTDVEQTCALLPGAADAASTTARQTAGTPAGASGDTDGTRPHDHLTVEELLVHEALPVRTSAAVDRLCSVAGLSVASVLGILKRLERQGLAEQRREGWRRGAAGG